MTAPSPKRIRAERSGRLAEALAAWAYRLRGFQILGRRFKAAGGEIDIVARKGGLLVFVEVKRRADVDAALYAVTYKNRRRLEQAVKVWLSRNPRQAGLDIRYDIAAVAGWRVEIAESAWRDGQ